MLTLAWSSIMNLLSEAVVQRCSVKMVFLNISQNSQENTCARVSFLIKFEAEACNFIKKETLAQVLSCEFCEISGNTYFTEHLRATACIFRNSQSQMLFKIGALKNFTNFTGKQLCWHLFLMKLKGCNFIKKRLQLTCFPVKLVKFLREPFSTEHLR